MPAAASEKAIDLYWQAQRLELAGQPEAALKNYTRLIADLPTSAVAADKLLASALLNGDLKNALRAMRAQQLSENAGADGALLFFVDSWRRNDWVGAKSAAADLKTRENYAFMEPLLTAWINVVNGRESGVTTDMLRSDPILGYYAGDQLVYLDFAQGNFDGAKERLTRLNGYAEDFGRQLALTSAPWIIAHGDAEFAKALMQHVGGPTLAGGKLPLPPKRVLENTGLAAFFARLSDQFERQGAKAQSLYFARLAHWAAPDDAVAKMTLARRLASFESFAAADSLSDGIAVAAPQWSWAKREQAQMREARGDHALALSGAQSALKIAPGSQELWLLYAQLQDAQGDRTNAITTYRALIARATADNDPPRRLAVFNMLVAQVLERDGDWKSAQKALETALKLDGDNPQLLNYLGYSLLERREDIKRGFALVEAAHRLSPNSPEIGDSLGWGYALNGQHDRAIPLLESAVETALNDVTINEHLGDTYWQAGRRIEARYAWRAASMQAKDSAASRIVSKLDIGLTESNAAP